MENALHRSLHLKLKAQIVDLLASWPLRHGISCALLGVAVLLVWSMIPHRTKAAAATGAPATIPTRPDPGTVAQQVANLHLFGENPAEAVAAPAAPVANIKVQGLIYSDDKDSALAILEVNGKSDFFKVGDALPDGEKLTAITPSAIQLSQGMAQRMVEMSEQFGGPADGMTLTGDTGLAANGAQIAGLALPGAQTYQSALRTVSVPEGASPLDQLRSLRQQLITQQPAPLNPTKHPAKP